MNITIVSEVFGEANNGTTIAAINLINYLKSQNHNVKVVCPDIDKVGKENYYVLPTVNLGRFINNILKRNNVVAAKYDESVLYEAMKDADVVHFMMPLFIAKKASKLAKKLNKPITAGFHAQAENLTSHIFMQNIPLANHLAYKLYNNNLYCRCDAIHYPTQFIKEYFEKEIKKETNAYVISNGVNDSFCNIENKPIDDGIFRILFIGRLSKEKTHESLIKAVAKSKYKDKIQLYFAGQGPSHNKLLKLSKKLNINTPIIKFYTRDELKEVITQASLYVHASTIEIEAISALEAIAGGLVPIISNSPRSATRFFALDERNLFDYKKIITLTNKIDHFIENPQEISELQEKYKDYTKQFNQTYCMQQMEKMFIDIVNK